MDKQTRTSYKFFRVTWTHCWVKLAAIKCLNCHRTCRHLAFHLISSSHPTWLVPLKLLRSSWMTTNRGYNQVDRHPRSKMKWESWRNLHPLTLKNSLTVETVLVQRVTLEFHLPLHLPITLLLLPLCPMRHLPALLHLAFELKWTRDFASDRMAF